MIAGQERSGRGGVQRGRLHAGVGELGQTGVLRIHSHIKADPTSTRVVDNNWACNGSRATESATRCPAQAHRNYREHRERYRGKKNAYMILQ